MSKINILAGGHFGPLSQHFARCCGASFFTLTYLATTKFFMRMDAVLNSLQDPKMKALIAQL